MPLFTVAFLFLDMNKMIFNGRTINADTLIIGADNRGLRYGDGIFETMKMIKGRVILPELHIERLFTGLKLLGFDIGPHFSPSGLEEQMNQLCFKNNCTKQARIRLMVFRGNGGLYDPENNKVNYVIQAWPLNDSILTINENGLEIDIYQDARKSCDLFSNLKSANFLPYIMASFFAKSNKLNDCLVLNQFGRIADATLANIFIIRDRQIMTPPLSEGCVAGVMRKHIIQQMALKGNAIHEHIITPQDIANAEEVFLTNAIYGIRWVKQCGRTRFTGAATKELYLQIISPLIC
ncbi:MAG: 4-amino-4-deoxychorismate lyase [Terrimonas sp.]|nr:4-amino-4-deoxychorismate lyase [Terrimonas sp.]